MSLLHGSPGGKEKKKKRPNWSTAVPVANYTSVVFGQTPTTWNARSAFPRGGLMLLLM